MKRFWVQDNNGQGWVDSFGFETKQEAIDWYEKLIADPIWLNEGKRRWRVIERNVEVIVLSS